jgi:hypothetical protein
VSIKSVAAPLGTGAFLRYSAVLSDFTVVRLVMATKDGLPDSQTGLLVGRNEAPARRDTGPGGDQVVAGRHAQLGRLVVDPERVLSISELATGEDRGVLEGVLGARIGLLLDLVQCPLIDMRVVITKRPDERALIRDDRRRWRFYFAIGNGPSREITAVYRSGQRELSASTTLRSKVHPTFRLKQKVVHNGGYAVSSSAEPHANGVVVELQVKDGKGWRTIRR